MNTYRAEEELITESGPKGYLTEEEEEELVTFVIQCVSIGNGKTLKDVLALAQRILSSRRKEVSLTGGWWDSFIKRQPHITLRTPAALSSARSKATSEEVIDLYFYMLDEILHQNGVLDKPGQIFNMDESGMPLDPKPPKTIHLKEEKNPSAFSSGNKVQITTMAGANAAGQCILPMAVWDRKTMFLRLA